MELATAPSSSIWTRSCVATEDQCTTLIKRVRQRGERPVRRQGHGCGRLEAEIAAKRRVYDAAKAQVDSVRTQLEDAKADLTAVNFNNALLKRVRAARPVIANKLWAKVLATVSRYFGLMRGDNSA
jgi:hypothetical protein